MALVRAATTVGREQFCDLIVPDPAVSRYHLIVHVAFESAGNPRVSVQRVVDAKPARINGVEIEPTIEVSVAVDDLIEFGSSVCSIGALARADADHLVRLRRAARPD